MLRSMAVLVACGLATTACEAPERAEPPAAPPSSAPAAAAPAAEPATPPMLTAEGWGPLKVGMAEAAASEALGGAVSSDESPACRHLTPKQGPEGLLVMIRDGRVARVTLHGSGPVRTDRGLGLGASEIQVRAAYPDGLEAEPHHYLGLPAKYLTWWSRTGERGVRYETNAEGVVTEIHAGDDSIRLVEGCS